MGRIEEALRRDGQITEHPAADTMAPPDVFASAWTVEQEPVRKDCGFEVVREEPAVTSREDVPSGSHGSGRPMIASFKTDWRDRLAIGQTPDPLLVDQFRRLAGTLLHNPNDLRTVMVTSASPADGKSLTALNLALVLSSSYRRRVLLIEGDLRRPSIASAAGLPIMHGGLTEVLKAPTDRKVKLVQLTEFLTLMPAGRPDSDPLSGLTSTRFQHLLQEAAAQYDWVILDTPPLGAGPDAALMAPFVDAVLFVVRAHATPHALIQRAISAIGTDRILGVVLNGVDAIALSGYTQYYGDYAVAAPGENSR